MIFLYLQSLGFRLCAGWLMNCYMQRLWRFRCTVDCAINRNDQVQLDFEFFFFLDFVLILLLNSWFKNSDIFLNFFNLENENKNENKFSGTFFIYENRTLQKHFMGMCNHSESTNILFETKDLVEF